MTDNRLDQVFARCKQENRAALVGYLTAGDPGVKISESLLLALAESVDILEIGMPFSDPMADGPVIQQASERALEAGTHMRDVFALTAKVRQQYPDVGIVLMGYANSPYAMGIENFARESAQAGADGVLIVDVPAEESAIWGMHLKTHGLHRIMLLAPTSSEERIALACREAGGFIYYVSLTGITGADMGDIVSVRQQVERIRQHTDLPVCVGFGIKTPQQAQAVAAFSDGVVVGSAFVSQIPAHAGDAAATLQSIRDNARALRAALCQPA